MRAKGRAVEIYGGKDPAELPAYPIVEVAHFLWMRGGNLSRWTNGYRADGRKHPPLLQIADPRRGLLSFNNLSELHVLSALRGHQVPLQRIRRALQRLRVKLGDHHPHPLLAENLLTDGIDVFAEGLGSDVLENLSRHGQLAMAEIFRAYLQRIDRDPNSGTVLRLFPMVRPYRSPEELAQQPRVVSIDPLISFGRPVLHGTRVPTDELAERFSAGETFQQLADDLGLESSVIEEAIRYELAGRHAA